MKPTLLIIAFAFLVYFPEFLRLAPDMVAPQGTIEKDLLSPISSDTLPAYWVVGATNRVALGYDQQWQPTRDTIDLKAAINAGPNGFIHWGNVQARDIAIDDQGRIYLLDVGYSKRVYRFSADFQFDGLVFDLAAYESDPEGIAADSNGIYLGGRGKTLFHFDEQGAFLQSYDLSPQLEGLASQLGAIRKGQDGQWYVLDSYDDVVYQYHPNWQFTGHSWSVSIGQQGKDANGMEQCPDGSWVFCDIRDDAFHVFDEQFSWLSTTPHIADPVLTGIAHSVAGPVVEKTPDPEPVAPGGIFPNTYWAVGMHTGLAYRYDSTLAYANESIDLTTAINTGPLGKIHWGTVRPKDLARDQQGRWYILDIGYSDRIYRFNADFTFDGFWLDVATQETNPEGLAVDSLGNLYVGGRGKTVYQYDSAGTWKTSFDVSAQLTASLSMVAGLYFHKNQWWVIDAFDNTVYAYNADFWYTGNSYRTTFSNNGNAKGTNPNSLFPKGESYWIVSDINDDAFHIYNADYEHAASFAQAQDDVMTGIVGITEQVPNEPDTNAATAMLTPSDSIWAVGSQSGTAYLYDSTMAFRQQAIDLQARINAKGRIHWGSRVQARDLAQDAQGRWYVLDIGYSDRVYRFDRNFVFDGFVLDVSAWEGQPEAICLTNQGNILIGGRAKKIVAFDSAGQFLQEYSVAAQLTGSSSQIASMRWGQDERLYLLDSYLNRVHTYNESFVYQNQTFSTVFLADQVGGPTGQQWGTNPNGLVQKANGNWLITDIQDGAYHLYDDHFQPLSSSSQGEDGFMTGIDVLRPLAETPPMDSLAQNPDTPTVVANFWVTNYDRGHVYQYGSDLQPTGDAIDLKARINAGILGTIHYGQSKPRDLTRDTAGNWYVVDIGYQDRVYRFRPDWTYDNFFIYTSGEDDFTEAIEIGQDELIYVGGRDRVVYVYSPQNGQLLDSIPLINEIPNPNGAIFAIRQGQDGRFYILEGQDDHVLVYESDWTYAGIAYDYTFSHPVYDGTNGYGLEQRRDGGWIISDIKYVDGHWTAEFNLYDAQFHYEETVEIAQPGVASGVVRE